MDGMNYVILAPWMEMFALGRLNLVIAHTQDPQGEATRVLRREHLGAQDRIAELYHFSNPGWAGNGPFVAAWPGAQVVNLDDHAHLLQVTLGPAPRTVTEINVLFEAALELERGLAHAQFTGAVDPILGEVVPLGSYPPSPSFLFHPGIFFPLPRPAQIVIQSVMHEDGDLAGMEEDWLDADSSQETISVALSTVSTGPPPPPPSPSAIVNHPSYGFDWPEAMGPHHPNGVVISLDTDSEGSEEVDLADWADLPAAAAEDVADERFGILDVTAAFYHAQLG